MFKSIVTGFSRGIAEYQGEIYWAIFRKLKSQTQNLTNLERVYFYINQRFKLYSSHVLNSLNEFLEDPEENANHPIYHAFFYYVNPHKDSPEEKVTEWNKDEISFFHRDVNFAYKELKKKLTNG